MFEKVKKNYNLDYICISGTIFQTTYLLIVKTRMTFYVRSCSE